MRPHRLIPYAICSLLLLVPLTGLAGTSPFLLDRQPTGQLEFSYRFQHSHFAGDLGSYLDMQYHEFSLGLPVSPDFVLSLSAPLANWGVDSAFEPNNTTEVGNLTVGAHLMNLGAQENMSFLIALQLPTMSNDVFGNGFGMLGILAHPSVWQTFVPDVLTVQTHFTARIPASDESFLRLEVGPDLLFPTGDNDGSTLVHMRYGLGVGVATGRLGASIEFGGFWETDGDGDGFSENSAHMLAAGVEYVGAVVRPAVYYQIPTDDELGSFLDGVLGLRITLTP